MKRQVLESIAGVDIYPIISLVIFFAVFSLVLVRAITASKSYIDEVSALPLDDDGLSSTPKNIVG